MYISYINSKETKVRYVKNTHTHRCVEMRIKMLKIVGFGSGAKENMTMEAASAIASADLIVGYKTYVDILKQYFPDKEYYSTDMMQEKERCQYAIKKAEEGTEVALVCSGDSGIYGMASLVYELAPKELELKVISGVTAACSGAACLGAPLSHDFAVISLSDCMTPLELIKKRVLAAASSDMVMCLYNPSSRRRAGYLKEICDIVLKVQAEDIICGYVKNIGRENEQYRILTLKELRDSEVDMFTTVYIGNSQTKVINGKMVTPRGYKTE